MTLGSKARPFISEWGKRGGGYRTHRQIFKLGRMKLHSRFTFFRLGKEAVSDQ